MKVFVTGGTGYVGQVVVNSLVRVGHEVTLLQRGNSPRQLQQEGVKAVSGDLFDVESLREGMRDHDAVIHLVGIIREIPRKGITMFRVHVEGTQNVLKAAQDNHIGRFLHMSALNTHPGAVSKYHRSKWEGEVCVRDSGMVYTIFRPSVVFGRGGPGPEFVGQLIDLVKSTPVVPLVGDGHFLLQPVSAQTVGEAFAKSLTEPCTHHQTYELGGPSVLSYLQILQHIADALGKKLRTISIPVFLMKRLVPLLQNAPGFPITVDQLTMLLEGNVCEDAQSIYEDLALGQVPFAINRER